LTARQALQTTVKLVVDRCQEILLSALGNVKELQIETEIAVGGDLRSYVVAVGQLRWNIDSAFTSNGHTNDSNIHSLDDLSNSNLEAEWLALFVGCNPN
jgi:hypothetical protein